MNRACDVAPDELIAFTEEDLPERRMKELEAHVPSCATCQERLTSAQETMTLLRESLPEPDSHSRHDLLVRLYQEAESQTDHPHRSWTQVASLTAVCGTFLIAAVLLWSGIGQFIDLIPRPFQQASQDQAIEWVGDEQASEMFETAPLPNAIGESYPLYDHWVRAGIRLIIYQADESNTRPIEVSQFFVEDTEPPGYMEQIATVEGVPVYVDNPDFIREVRWTDGELAHHLQMYVPEPDDQSTISQEEAEAIVQAFLDAR